jgi:NitT/TauT family transport system substrate-binding protein
MFFRPILAAIGLSAAAFAAHAQTNMPFALDWRFEGPAAPYFWPSTTAISTRG